MLSKKTRNHLLVIASMLDGWAASIRKYVRRHTPKRTKVGEDIT